MDETKLKCKIKLKHLSFRIQKEMIFCYQNCSSDQEKRLKFEAESWEFSKILRSVEQFIQWRVRTIFGNIMLFSLVPGGFSDLIN